MPCLISFLWIAALIATPARAEFLWGAGHSAFQVEGAPLPSDWKTWTETPGKIRDGTNANAATDFWKRYGEDFALAQELGANAFRISIAWERIEPREGVYDLRALDHYVKIVTAMRRRGLEPVVTLQHFVLPDWLAARGGLLAPQFVARFAAYFGLVSKKLAAAPTSVKYFMTINEPMVLVNGGYLDGIWPPGLKDPKLAIEAAAQLARAHIRAYQLTRQDRALDAVQISIAKHWRRFEGKGLLGPLIAELSDWAFNRQIMKALTTGHLYFWMPGASSIKEDFEIPPGRAGFLDYLGLNYYGRLLTSFTTKAPYVKVEEGPGEKTDLGWEIYSPGLHEILVDLKRYHLPILISENGLADADDSKRTPFLQAHLAQMERAIRESGAPVIGYLHWSLTDNFEWAFGLEPRFGLVAYDYATKTRKPRPSFDVYKKLIEDYRAKGLK